MTYKNPRGDLTTAQRIPSKAKVKTFEDYSRIVKTGGRTFRLGNTAAQEKLLAKQAAKRKRKK